MTEALPNKQVKLPVAIADVDAIVKKDSAIDEHARLNTTSVYTAGRISPYCRRNSLRISLLSIIVKTGRPWPSR